MENLDVTAAQGAAGTHPAEQAGLVDGPLLVEALTQLGASTPEGQEVAEARVGHLTHGRIRQALHGKEQHRQRTASARSAEAPQAADQQGNYSPAELRAFNAGRAFAERVACAEQNARSLAVTKIALDGLGDSFAPWKALQEIVEMLYPDLADLVDQDPALARRALNALQPG